MESRQRVGAITELPHVLRRFGIEARDMLAAAGLPPGAIDDPEGALTFPEVGRLFEVCVAATRCPHLVHLVGERAGTGHLGVVGMLMRNAPTVGAALMDLCSNQQRYVRGAVAYMAVQGQTVVLGYAIYCPDMPSPEHFSEGCLAAGFNMVRELAKRGVDEVLSARQAVADPQPYRSFYGVTPRFDAEQYALAFPAAVLDWPVIGADADLRRRLEGEVERYWALRQPTVAERAVRQLRARVIIGDATRERLAELLDLSTRSLNRRLQEEGTSFRELLDRARFQVAQQLLLGTRMPVTAVALALGYAEASAFNHAFQRWSGERPSDWRKRTAASPAPGGVPMTGAGTGEAVRA
ncbi:MAG: AraC family transcriptional regulator ligand-binding domain-containing protein [Reyranellaceae bacterium]